ncbi:hypothetical protein K439DRAFT_1624376 [Ramaria rubella]|nr:hypothetical protein K439DRAFT_1624376 [Ramaria rubella]
MSTLSPEIQEIIDLYDQWEAAGWEWNSGDLYNVPILADDFDAFKDVDHALEGPFDPWYTNFPVASHVESSTDMDSLSTIHPTVQEQCHPMHMAALGPDSAVETSPWWLVGSSDPGMNMEAVGYQETWYMHLGVRVQNRTGVVAFIHVYPEPSMWTSVSRWFHPQQPSQWMPESASQGSEIPSISVRTTGKSNGFPANYSQSETRLSPDQAIQWNATGITLTENVAVEQLGRSPHGSSATHRQKNDPSSAQMELWTSASSTSVQDANQRT